ncbi:hypothetical protein PF007_g21120 [Phytophthora fragariae]|uniref:Uncharacterized protein n=2 Tax=Phytophthora fragariae TaxID=53985 RepID=A0A6A3QZ47_9STRA|nr:hypothetical protein PF007_g21120 [Phytophthora fragariae]
MPHAIAQAQGAIRAVGAALGFDSSRPREATNVVAPQVLGEPSSDAPPADTAPTSVVDGAPSSGSVSPSEDASTEVLSSPIVIPLPSAGVPSSPTSVPASAHGASDEPQAASAVGAPAVPVPEIVVPEVAPGRAGQAPPTPVRPSVGGAVLDLAVPQSLSSPHQNCHSPVSPPNSPHDPSLFCRTNSRYAAPPVEPVPSARESASAYALEGVVQDASDSTVRRLEAFNERLESARNLDTIVHAVAPGANTPPPANWDTEMEILRVDVRYHRDQLRECEMWLYKETDLRRQAESLCAVVSYERNEAVEVARALREERDEVSRQAALAAVSLQKSADIIDLLKARIGEYDKKIEGPTFHQYLESRQRDRESGCLVDHGTDTALPEGFQALLDQVRSIQLHPTETSAGSKRPASSSSAAVHAGHEADSSPDESSEDSDVVLIEPPAKRRKRSSTSPKSKKKRSSSHSKSKGRSSSQHKSRLGKPSVDLRAKSSPSTATQGANSAPSLGHAGASPEAIAGSQGPASDQSAPVAPPPSALPAVIVPSSTAGCTPPPSPRRREASVASPSSSGPLPATLGTGTSVRNPPFETAVVIPPRRDGRPVRPASTVASLQSKSAVERENASDAMVLGSNPSGSSSSVRSVAGQDASDGFVYGSPSMTFETMVIGTKARAAKPAKATKTKSAKAKSSNVAKPPKAVKPPRVVKHSSVQDYTDYHGPRPAAEAEEGDDEVLSEGNLSDASAASGSTKRAGSKHSSLIHPPPVQSDDGGAGAEEADDSAGSAAEDEESPDESVSKPPRAAIRLDVVATVAKTSK